MLSDLYVKRRGSLVRLLAGIVGNVHTAEDLAQEVFIRVGSASERGTVRHLDAFLYKTARNLGLDHQRQRARRSKVEVSQGEDSVFADVPAKDAAPECQIIERERMITVTTAISALPPRARQALYLAHVEGRTYGDIAQMMGVSRNTIYNDIKFAIAHCHDALRRAEEI